ncbi:MAG: DUF5602 domain-containing protein [Fimbriimonadaceae bacterium]|nr:DUF5602 domain-containing protein [Fimbriimonadaceae bacterium]
MKTGKISIIAMVAMATAAVSACPFCQTKTTGTFIGETVLMGNGTARSWVRIGEDKKPEAVGVTMSESAFENLPKDMGEDGMGHSFLVTLPKQANVTPFNHVSIDWNPEGHEPAGIYTTPHLDFHFYMVSTAERAQMRIVDGDLSKFQKPVPNGMMSKGYVYAPGAEMPYMGAHWVNPKSPEFNGTPFTQTFIFGSYNGNVHFFEPMVDLGWMLTKPQSEQEIVLPEKVAKPGYYPTVYKVTYDTVRKEYSVTLERFVYRK